MLPLINKELKSHEDPKICYICGKYFTKKLIRDINLEIIAIMQEKIEDQCTVFVI